MSASQSLAQGERGSALSLFEQLRLSRKVARVLAPTLNSYPIGIDFSDTANIQVTQDKVLLFVRTPVQKAKLRQLMQRIQNAVAETGLVQPVELQVRPITPKFPEPAPVAEGEMRRGTLSSARSIEKAARSMSEDSPLRARLERLAKALRANARGSQDIDGKSERSAVDSSQA